jgi:hypothetical protein
MTARCATESFIRVKTCRPLAKSGTAELGTHAGAVLSRVKPVGGRRGSGGGSRKTGTLQPAVSFIDERNHHGFAAMPLLLWLLGVPLSLVVVLWLLHVV